MPPRDAGIEQNYLIFHELSGIFLRISTFADA
jgi:hypothetical protein